VRTRLSVLDTGTQMIEADGAGLKEEHPSSRVASDEMARATFRGSEL
jgi:hypothetical protein